MKNIVFTGGGTGGHIYPGLAVVEELRRLLDGKCEYKIIWIGSNKGMDKELVEKSGLVDEFVGISCGKLRRYFSVQNFFDLFKIGIGFLSSFFKLSKFKACVVFSKGGFVSVPPCYAAKFLKIPVYTHECDFTTGLATRLNMRIAKNLFVTYADTKDKLPAAIKNKTIVSGNPVRNVFFDTDKKSGWTFVTGTDILPEKPVLLVVGGSLGAKQINELIWENIDWLCERFVVIHQTGKQENPKEIKHKDYYSFDFIYSQMSDVMSCCDVIFSRAGANFLWEATVQRKPMLLLPLGEKGSRGDQIDNAEYFKSKGCSLVLDFYHADSISLKKALEQILDKNVRFEMSECCKKLLGNEKSSSVIAKKIIEEVL
ncbi:MAG: UDP-N-acetylglucosamine--N-acetylmuramyl-(pentapeptide) pyrophosphoryl-undecaprenol N-acetylglucosamine transferase [Treponemataceae bacterium]